MTQRHFLQLFSIRVFSLCCFYVYGYRHPVTKVWRYIGKGYTKGVYDRKGDHLWVAQQPDWKAQDCYNPRLICWIRKLLREDITPEIVILKASMSNEDAYAYEAELIALIGRVENGGMLYNLTDGGEGGRNPSREARRRMGWNKGKKLTEEHKLRISDANKGKPSWHKGRKHSEETKCRISKAKMGHITSNATKDKLRRANLGRIHSEETRRKCREANLGKIVLEETRELLRQNNLGKNLGKKRVYCEDGSFYMERPN